METAVLLVDDHPVVRKGLRVLLEEDEDVDSEDEELELVDSELDEDEVDSLDEELDELELLSIQISSKVSDHMSARESLNISS